MRMMLVAALAVPLMATAARADDDVYVTIRGQIMCTTQEMLRQALQAIRDKKPEILRTVQGCRESIAGVRAELLQDNVSMIKIRLGELSETVRPEYWTLPETIKSPNKR
jgi:hypothetical protein